MSSLERSNQLRSTLNTNLTTGLDMCVKSATKKSVAQHFEHERYHRFGHVSSLQRKNQLRSTLNTIVITGLDMCQVCNKKISCAAL